MAHNLDPIDVKIIRLMAENDLRTTEVSHAVHMHRNGVLWRINRIKEKTGLDPKNFYDLCKLLEVVQDGGLCTV